MLRTGFDVQFSVACSAFILYLYFKRAKNASKLPLPPGPKKLPIIGNLLHMPTSFEWITYHKWCKEFGSDIIHLDVAGTSIIVLDSDEATTELLDKRSLIYSSRPRQPMINELMGWNFVFGFMPYGDTWREHRRSMQKQFQPTAVARFEPHELKATHGLLRRLLDEPDNLMGHLLHMAGETIMSVVYGLQVQDKDDPYITAAERGVRPLFDAAVPGAFLVDIFPILKHVPEWMPFAGFKRKAKEWGRWASIMVNMPFEATIHNIKDGNFTPSFVSYSLEQIDESGDVEQRVKQQKSIIKSIAGSLYTAGSDTTVSAIASCVLGLLSQPEVLKKAQEEIDTVVGVGQLPGFEHRESLPYITAIVKEVLRWRVVGPIAVPHALDIEDEYKGYRIPAGSIVIPNCWAIFHNEEMYPDPFTFNPDRFMKDGNLDPDIKDPVTVAFGFGRRICPGRHMAFSAIWMAVASMIAVFDISKAVDDNGKITEPSHEYISALVCLPIPFKCSIRPRSHQAESLIRATVNMEYF